MLDLFIQPETMIIFITLLALEVVLGIDNIVFISVLCERLPKAQQKFARNVGICLAVLAHWISFSYLMVNVFNRSFTEFRKP